MEPKDTSSGDTVESPDAPTVADTGENPTPTTAPGPESAETAVTEADVTAGPEAAEAPESAPDTAPDAAPDAGRRRPRGRTSLIWLAAAVLGVVVGGAVGYGVQADRDPTPLGTLAQKHIAYPAKPLAAGKVPDPLPASEDRQVKTDGDLTKMVVSPPEGAEKDDFFGSGWIDMSAFSAWYENPDYMFGELAGANVRRIARQSWLEGDRETKIDLVQYRSGSSLGAQDHFDDQMEYLPYDDEAGNEGDPIKGSLEGRYFLYPVDREEGYEPMYQARALAVRGDIVMDVVVFDTRPISKKTIRTLAERQLERL